MFGSEEIGEVYAELRKIAALHLSRRVPSSSLQPTQLVHEAWIRLAEKKWQSKTHFLALASRTMRHLIIDGIRAHDTAKRGFGMQAVEINPGIEIELSGLTLSQDQLLDLDRALNRLAEEDERQARVVEMRFFGGMELAEIAEALDVSLMTVKRDWRFSRAWLYSQLTGSEPDDTSQ